MESDTRLIDSQRSDSYTGRHIRRKNFIKCEENKARSQIKKHVRQILKRLQL